MKKYLLVLIALGIFFNWNTLRDEFSPPPDFSAQHPEGVVLYATDWCGYCKKTRDFFKQHNIAFVEYDIGGLERFRQILHTSPISHNL